MLVLAVALVGWSPLGLSACQNVCERAGERLLGCLEEICGRTPTHTACSDRAAFTERLAGGGACRTEDSPSAARISQASCDQLEQLLSESETSPPGALHRSDSPASLEGTE